MYQTGCISPKRQGPSTSVSQERVRRACAGCRVGRPRVNGARGSVESVPRQRPWGSLAGSCPQGSCPSLGHRRNWNSHTVLPTCRTLSERLTHGMSGHPLIKRKRTAQSMSCEGNHMGFLQARRSVFGSSDISPLRESVFSSVKWACVCLPGPLGQTRRWGDLQGLPGEGA